MSEVVRNNPGSRELKDPKTNRKYTYMRLHTRTYGRESHAIHFPAKHRLSLGTGSNRLRVLATILVLSGFVFTAPAYADAVCSNTPAADEWILCEEDATSTDDIDIDVNDVVISTTDTGDDTIEAAHSGTGDITIDLTGTNNLTTAGKGTRTIKATHFGTGSGSITIKLDGMNTLTTTNTDDSSAAHAIQAIQTANGLITIDLKGTNTITTSGPDSYGIQAFLTGEGPMNINIGGTTNITTHGEESRGVSGNHAGAGALDINLESGSTITTVGAFANGVRARHSGSESVHNATITANGGSVTTHNHGSYGVRVEHTGTGDAVLDLTNLTVLTEGTTEAWPGLTFSHGLYGVHEGTGDIDMDVTGGSIMTKGKFSYGIYGLHGSSSIQDTVGDVDIVTGGNTITTTGDNGHGIVGYHFGTGDIDMDVAGGSITTEGKFSYGIYGLHGSSSVQDTVGDVDIVTGDGNTITTTGDNSHAIVGYHFGTEATRTISVDMGGSLNVTGANAQGVRIGVVSDHDSDPGTPAIPERVAALGDDGYRRQTVTVNGPITSAGEGVYIANGGRVIIGPRGSIDSTRGIAILATGTVAEDNTDPNNVIEAIPPKLRVDLNLGGRRVAQVLNDGWIINDGGETTIAVNNTVLHDGATGVTGNIARNGVWDVTMLADGVNVLDYSNADPSLWTITDRAANVIAGRDFSASDFTEACPQGEVGFPNCMQPPPSSLPSSPPPEDVVYRVDTRLSAGPERMAGVHIEGNGEVYIGPQGSIEAASGIAILADGDAPELLVDLQLDGRRVAEVLGDDWIINDDGETTIVVNNVKLHDGQTGVVPGVSVANGAWDVTMLADGVDVADYSVADPAMWTMTDRASGLITDRDFSAADFIETQRDLMEPDAPMLVEEYAPRAAIYEALPNVLLDLQTGALSVAHWQGPTTPTWIRLYGRHASQDFERSTVGASYDADSLTFEAGATVWHSDVLHLRASLHHLTGSADVSSPNRGGDIDVRGKGLSVDAHWMNPGKAYLTGRISWTDYNLDLSSDTVGGLVSSLDADGYAVHVEAGHRRSWGTHRHWTPRVWLEHARVFIDGFTDTVDARASFPQEERTTMGIGVLAETVRGLSGGEWWLHGSVDVEHTLSGARTRTTVSGERLGAEPEENNVRIGLGSVWQRGAWHYRASLSAREVMGAGGNDYAGAIQVGMVF